MDNFIKSICIKEFNSDLNSLIEGNIYNVKILVPRDTKPVQPEDLLIIHNEDLLIIHNSHDEYIGTFWLDYNLIFKPLSIHREQQISKILE